MGGDKHYFGFLVKDDIGRFSLWSLPFSIAAGITSICRESGKGHVDILSSWDFKTCSFFNVILTF